MAKMSKAQARKRLSEAYQKIFNVAFASNLIDVDGNKLMKLAQELLKISSKIR